LQVSLMAPFLIGNSFKGSSASIRRKNLVMVDEHIIYDVLMYTLAETDTEQNCKFVIQEFRYGSFYISYKLPG
jgi:hypothetical protein